MPALTDQSFRFTVIAEGLDPEADDFEDRFFEAGCDDSSISVVNRVVALDFTRRAKSFLHAVFSAVMDVHKAGAKAVRIEPENWVTAAEIADDAGTSRQAITNFIQGTRGSKDFPLPVARATSSSPLFDRVSVARWLWASGRLETRSPILQARVVDRLNSALAGRVSFLPLDRLRQEQALELENTSVLNL
jgi:hypothetical protein